MRIHAFLVGALAVGCAASSQDVDDRVTRLPAPERDALETRQRAVDLAEANLDAARGAWNDAGGFRARVAVEARAAHARVDAANKAVGLAHQAAEPRLLVNATREDLLATQQLAAADAKLHYADDLLELRRAQIGARGADVDVARTRLALERTDRLRRHGLGDDLARDDVARAAGAAERTAAVHQGEVDRRRAAAEASRAAWVEDHHRFSLAARGRGMVTDTPGPPPAFD
jgi:hypothetical protein